MVIIVTGSVGTGKTTLAKKLAKFLNYEYVDVNKIISENNLSEGFDEKNKCEIIDTAKFSKLMDGKIGKEIMLNSVIDSHMSHYIDPKKVDVCIITKCDIHELKSRLEKRGYSKKKIRDNIETEIFNTCFEEAKEKGHKILLMDTEYDIDKSGLNLMKNYLGGIIKNKLFF